MHPPIIEVQCTCQFCFITFYKYVSFKISLLLLVYIYMHNQAQASDQFLATTMLATNKAICFKTKKINKSKMYF